MNIYTIKACKENEFIPIMQELNAFTRAKQQGQIINNVPRLLNLFEKYFRGLLYYKHHSKSPFIVEIDKKIYQVEIGGSDQYGNHKQFSMSEIHASLLREIFEFLVEYIDLEYFEKLIQITNAILLNKDINIEIKIAVLNSENNHFKARWHTLIRQSSYELATDTISIRKNFLMKIWQDNILKTTFLMQKEYQANIKASYNLYEFYSKTAMKLIVATSHFSDIPTYIKQELKYLKKKEKIDQKRLITFHLIQLIQYNNLFQLLDKESIQDIIDQYEDFILESHIQAIREALEFNPENFEINDFKFRLAEPDFNGFDLDNDIETVLQFVVHLPLKSSNEKQALGNGSEIFFERITSLYEDPIYTFLDELDMNINGMPLTFFSDSIGNLQVATLVTIKLSSFYHPHFDIKDEQFMEKDLKLEEAKRGGKYYPHKDLIVEKLHEAYLLPDFPLDIERKMITSNLISNYLIAYFSKSSKKNIHHEVFSITNIDSYLKMKNRYVEELNKFYIQDELIGINEFIEKTRITNSGNFFDFCYKFLELTIKKSIELSGLHIAFWEDESPIKEKKAQPIIFNMIRYLAEKKGIQISREVEAANGGLDFYFSYNIGTEILKVCVELKNAHHTELAHGIESQLPLYIRDMGKKEGIFLVLWYKNDRFNKPKAYDTVKDLNSYLLSKVPKRFKIKPLIIDCTKKVCPSKKASFIRMADLK